MDFSIIDEIRRQRYVDEEYESLFGVSELLDYIKVSNVSENDKEKLNTFFEDSRIFEYDFYVNFSNTGELCDAYVMFESNRIYYGLPPLVPTIESLFDIIKAKVECSQKMSILDNIMCYGASCLRVENFLNNYDAMNREEARKTLEELYIAIDNDYYKLKEPIEELFQKGSASIPKEFINEDGTVAVYRGEHLNSTKTCDSFSWTLSKEKADFFANRRKDKGVVLKAKAYVKDIRYYTNKRKEEEVLIDFKDIKNIKVI